MSEKLTSSSQKNPLFGMYCLQGKIALQLPQNPLRDLYNLFTGQHILSKEFLRDIWMYNNAFAFTSLGVHIDNRINTGPGRGPYCFKIQGELHHRLGSLLPADTGQPVKYAQIYIYDSVEAMNI